MIVALCGGVGGSRFLRALCEAIDPSRVTAIINTADDDWFHGLYVSPDPDIITYALAGEVDDERGWGLRGDTFRWLESLERFGHETWFKIGDRDLATHIHRTRLLRDGQTLSTIIDDIRRAFGVESTLLPMSDDPVRTVIETAAGDLPFQRYLVERHAQDAVRNVRFDGAAEARPAPGLLDALRSAEAIFIAPSNPIGSIGPILAVPGIREAMADARVPRVAVSPIINGRSLQPPAGEMMAALGHKVEAGAVARIYSGLVDTMLIDIADASEAVAIEASNIRAVVAPLMLTSPASRTVCIQAALQAAGLAAE